MSRILALMILFNVILGIVFLFYFAVVFVYPNFWVLLLWVAVMGNILFAVLILRSKKAP